MKHIIITRIKFDDDSLFEEYFSIMKNIYIPSINNQTNKNFLLGFIINPNHIHFLNDFFKDNVLYFSSSDLAKKYCFDNNIEIQTRHDCDDWMREDYIEKIQQIYNDNINKFDDFLIHSRVYKFDYYTNNLYLHSLNYNNNSFISMFLTICQKKVNHFIYDKNHRFMGELSKNIFLIDGGYTRLIIHKNNQLSKISDKDKFLTNITSYDLSIVIPTFDNVEYLDDCINSIKNSNGGKKIEVLIGIDNCEKTKKYILSNKNRYDNNIKFFYFEKNFGPYIVRNSLAQISNSNYLLFIDSDDILHKNLIDTIINSLSNYELVRFKFYNFTKNEDLININNKNINHFHSIGQFGILKNTFLSMNGYEPWICSADSEFKQREKGNNLKTKYINDVLYYRRRHNKNLTIRLDTGFNSDLRNHYFNIINKKNKEKKYQKLSKLHTANFMIIMKNGEMVQFSNFNNNISNFNIKVNQKINISLIIPAFKNPTMLSECLNSIRGYSDCEILVGIDGCEETLEYVKKNKYNENIRFFYFDKNNGPYIVRNSLAKISNSDTLLFFDSDDIMKENMISDILGRMSANDFVKPMYSDFTNTPNYNITRSNTYGEGVFAIKKDLFLSMNGFEPWPIAADSDFMGRLYKNNKKFSYTNDVVFYRRVHPNSLTQRKDTGLSSPLRGKYYSMSKRKSNFGPLQELTIAQFAEVYTNKIYNTDVTIQLPPKKDISDIVLVHPKTIDYGRINEIITKRPDQNKNLPNQKPEPQKPIVAQNKPVSRNVINETKNSQRHNLAKLSIKKK